MQGIRIDLNGETIYETDDNVIEVVVGSDKGESARIGTREESVNRIYLEVVKEGTLNKHLDAVDREKIAARREVNRQAEAEESEETTPVEEETTEPPAFNLPGDTQEAEKEHEEGNTTTLTEFKTEQGNENQ